MIKKMKGFKKTSCATFFLHGITLLELLVTIFILGITVASISNILPHFFQLSKITSKHINQISDIQVLLTYFNKYLVNVDCIYFDRDLVLEDPDDPDSEKEVINSKKLFFRQTYLDRSMSFTTEEESLKTRWGCFWFQKVEEDDQIIGQLKYFRSQEKNFHEDEDLVWETVNAFSVRDINFSYEKKTLFIFIKYLRGEKEDTRKLIFTYGRSQDSEEKSDRLEEGEEPEWT